MSEFSVKISARDLETLVETLRRKQHREATVALQSDDGWDGPGSFTSGGETIEVHTCSTPLALRAALRPTPERAPWRFFLTPLTDLDIPLDLREKLIPHQRILPPNPADSLKAAFSATRMHSDVISDHSDIPALLSYLDATDATIRPAAAGVLSAGHVFQELLFGGLFDARIATLEDLLTWSAGAGAGASWETFTAKLPETVQSRALAWLEVTLGAEAGAALRHLATHGPEGLISYGLVAEVLIPTPGVDAATQRESLGSFRTTTGTGTLRTGELQTWARAAVSAFTALADEDKSVAITAQQTITSAHQLNAPQLLHLSSVAPDALEERLSTFADALDYYLQTGAAMKLYKAHEAVRRHVGTAPKAKDVRATDAAMRLIQWLSVPAKRAPSTAAGWLTHYRDELSWVDSCVNAVWWRQDNPRLGEATRTLAERVREHRAGADRAFAATVAATGASRAAADDVLLIEDVLADVVGPVLGADKSAPRPVLLIVVDGCSVPAANDVVQSIMSTYPGTWQELLPSSDRLRTALAALPTITNLSRTSLLSGEIAYGQQNTENSGFTAAYRRLGGRAGGAKLLHKSDIETGIADKVGEDIENTEGIPLLGAILNEIDDSLSSTNPMDRTWTADHVGFLGDLLQRAARVGRNVVLVSDHGHIAERHTSGMVSNTGASAARWRPATSPATDGEVRVSGPRVVADGASEAVLAVDDTIRYTAKTAGYHGGLSLAEACVPITVLTQSATEFQDNGVYPGETMTRATRLPSWWDIRRPSMDTAGPEPDAPATPAPAAEPDQGVLNFGTDQKSTSSAAPKDRFSALVKSSNTLLHRQVQAHPVRGRTTGDVVDLLRDIAANHRRMPLSALRERWGLSALTLRGAETSLRRIVNMDGIEVLTVEGTDLVLNPDLLFEQFGV